LRGAPADARSDVWALGTILAELSAGMVDASPAFHDVIGRAVDPDPARRYSDAGEVRAALDAIQAGTRPVPLDRRESSTHRRWIAVPAVLVGIGAIVVGLDVGGIRHRLAGRAAAAAPIKLAVLPFENLTGDPDQEYFSDGLTVETIARLGRLHPQRLTVTARTSSMRYKKRDTPIDQIGRELGVDYIMEGSVRREGRRVRISTILIQVRDQAQRWSDSFERDLSGILALQSEVARGVTGSLALTLLPAEQARLANTKEVNPDAYEAYLKGLIHVGRLTRSDLDAAEEYFEAALAKDPEYAAAYVGLSKVWSGRQQMQFVAPKEAAPRLRAAAQKALQLDGSLAEAHERLAVQSAWTDWNWPAAEREFQRTIELGPDLAEARALYSHFLYIMKRPRDGRVQIRRATDLDPLSDQVRQFYAVTLQIEHRFADAEVELRNALRSSPKSNVSLTQLSEALHFAGRYEEALAAERARWAARGDDDIIAALTNGYSEAGYRRAMLRAADSLAMEAATSGAQSLPVARLCVRAGAVDRALDWLERHSMRTIRMCRI
jgi:TolB-like protein/Tfp pilus assembly protein PilF